MGTQTLIWARAVSAGHARPAGREAQPGLGRAVAVAVDVDAAAGQAGQGTVAVRGDRGSGQAGGGRPGPVLLEYSVGGLTWGFQLRSWRSAWDHRG